MQPILSTEKKGPALPAGHPHPPPLRHINTAVRASFVTKRARTSAARKQRRPQRPSAQVQSPVLAQPEITVTLTFCFWKFLGVKNTEKKQFRQNYIFSNFNIHKMYHFVNVKVKT